MSKPKLLIADSNLRKPWLQPLWQQWFDVAEYDPGQRYQDNSVVLTDNRFGEKTRYQQIKQHNYRIILPYLMDSDVNDHCEINHGELVLRARDWIWIQESQQWRHFDYHVPREPQVPHKFFLLLMNLKRENRDELCRAVSAYLDASMYSYVERGITLPEDVFVPHDFHLGTANDRLYVPSWYAQTCFSLVSETYVKNSLFISEKIFKPLAYQHPMVVYGTPGTLEYLRSLGFETFGHCIDETYDTVPNDPNSSAQSRLNCILAVLENLYREFQQTGQVFQDSTTQQILAHNHARFFDQQQTHNLFYQQVVQPIMEFVES